MDRPIPDLRLEAITLPRQDIMRIWRTLRPVDCAFIQGIIGDVVMLTETLVDWIFLRTAAEFWDPQHAVFNFQGTELAPTIEEYTTLIQRPTSTIHGIFMPNPFTTVQGQLSTLLHIPAQDIHEELHQRWDQGIRIAWLSDWALLRAMTPTTASYQRDACHGFLLLIFGTLLFPYSSNLIDGAIAQVVLQAVGGHGYVEALLAETVRSLDYVREIWLLAHIRPFCSSHPFSYIADERSLIERLVPVIPPPEHSFSEWRRFWRELTLARFLWVARWNPGSPMITGCPGIVGVPLLSHLGSTLIFPGQGALDRVDPSTRSGRASRSGDGPLGRGVRPGAQKGTQPRPPLGLADALIFALARTYAAFKRPPSAKGCRLYIYVSFLFIVITTGVTPLPDSSTSQNDGRRPSRHLRGSQPAGSGPFSTASNECSAASDSRRHAPGILGRPSYAPPAPGTSSATDDQARITALEGTVNQMAANMAELLALHRGSNRASSSSTPPPGQGPTVDPAHRIPPAQVPENMDAPAPPTLHTSVAQPFTNPYPPPRAPTAVPLPPAAFLTSDQGLSAPPPVSMPAPATAYIIPSPTVFPTSGATAPIHFQTTEFPPYSSLQPHAGLSYSAPPPINTTFHEPGTPAHVAHLFPGMRLPPKFKIPEFKAYGGMTDPRHHLRHYWGKMLQYWEYEEFLSTKEMARGQRFEEYAAKWRAQAAKHIPPISEVQQVQLFHSTLRGIYYSHLLVHTSSFSDLIEAGKKLDLGIKLGRMEGPADKREEPSRKAPATSPSFGWRRGKEVSVNAVNTARQSSQQYSANPRPDHRSSSGPFVNMISICVLERDEEAQENPPPFVINYTPKELTVGLTGHLASSAPFVVDIPARESYSDSRVPWTYEGSVGNVEQQFSVMGLTRSGRVYENPAANDKGKALIVEGRATPESSPFPSKKVTEEEAEAFMKIMNMDLNRVRPSRTAVRAFDGSRREVNGEIDLLIDVGPCSISITFQRQTGGHGVMNNVRRAGSLRKRKAIGRTNGQRTPKPQSWHCGTIHHRVTEAPKGAQYGTSKIPLSAKVTNDTSGRPGTTRVEEQASDNLPELDSVSRRTFQWSRTSPGEPSGYFHGKQRLQQSLSTSQRSPSTLRHSENTRKIPVKVPRSSRANGPQPRATSQQSLTGQKDRQNE
ncbi:hypothetical protein CRG98_017590 [Punica granatum]|uniref:DUF7745 domain-containing protein n=1 Tax=Punica granatum TaxID=22663 RepID=A0A2I0K0A8_PUNGR|nr:hypothetical protein CRG98_017590 [Punica granatum]